MTPERPTDNPQDLQLFSKAFDRRVRITLLVVVSSILVGVSLTLYAAWPSRIRLGYAPDQPIPFSHLLHAGTLAIACQYCHTQTDRGAEATLPTIDICMNCHLLFKPDGKKKEQVRKINLLMDYWEKKQPILWNRVYDLSDFGHFYHNRHINVGLDCSNCHGAVETMPVMQQVAPLTMGWCIQCHKGKTPIRLSQDAIVSDTPMPVSQKDAIYGRILAPIHCSTCHW